MHNNIKCTICNHNASLYKSGNITAFTAEDLKITDSQYGKHWDLWKCVHCSTVFTFPLPEQSMLIETYHQMQDDSYSEEETGRKRNFARLFHCLEHLQPGKGRLLDVGAASGLLVELARLRGWQSEGIEVSTSLVEAAKQRNIILHQASIEDFNAEIPYDVVTAVDIIEHLHEPERLLKNTRLWLANDGLLCLVTPDIDSVAARIFSKKWWHFRPAHLYYFNRKSISFLLEKNGFQLLSFRHYVWHFSLSYLLSKFKFLPNPSILKNLVVPLNLFDSLEIYARKSTS